MAYGSVKGLRARGGFEVELIWKDGALGSATIHNRVGRKCRVRYGSRSAQLKIKRGDSVSINRELMVI